MTDLQSEYVDTSNLLWLAMKIRQEVQYSDSGLSTAVADRLEAASAEIRRLREAYEPQEGLQACPRCNSNNTYKACGLDGAWSAGCINPNCLAKPCVADGEGTGSKLNSDERQALAIAKWNKLLQEA